MVSYLFEIMKNNCTLFTSITLLLCNILTLTAQNLVPNGSFEQYVICPSIPGQLDNTNAWFSPNTGDPDFFNECAEDTEVWIPDNMYGNQVAASGEGYVGIMVYGEGEKREYISNPLVEAMEEGASYCVEFKVSLADVPLYGLFGIQELGVYFSEEPMFSTDDTVIEAEPQVVNTTGIIQEYDDWVTISATFEADAAYEYINIGNFYDNANTTGGGLDPGTTDTLDVYYYIDDVSVQRVPSQFIEQADTIYVCDTDEVELTAEEIDGATYEWVLLENPGVVLSDDPTFTYTFDESAIVALAINIGECTTTDFISVEVEEVPDVDFSVDNACLDGLAQFIDLSSNVGDDATYEWDIFNDGDIDSDNAGSFEYLFEEAGEVEVALTIYNNDLCVGSIVQTITVAAICDPCADPDNLVPNGNMENFDECPVDLLGLSGINNWYQPTEATTDFFHTCFEPEDENNSLDVPVNTFGIQEPISGNGYMGFFAYRAADIYREYASVQLESPLEEGKTYCVSYNVSLSDRSNFAIENIGMYFSTEEVMEDTEGPLDANPQLVYEDGVINEKQDWVQITEIFTPNDSYEWLTIGNFKNDALSTIAEVDNDPNGLSSAYYYLEDVLITEIPDFESVDTTACVNETLVFTAPEGYCSYEWIDATNPGEVIDTDNVLSWTAENPGIYVFRLIVGKEACSFERTYSIVVNPNPDADFVVSAGCFQNVVAFINQSTNVDNETTYEWDFNNDGVIDATNSGSVGHFYDEAGIYNATLIVTNSDGCVSIAVQTVIVNEECDPCEPSNLIFNPSFEFYDDCPEELNEIDEASEWFAPNQPGADYYNACSNNGITGLPVNAYGDNVDAYDGDAYAGIVGHVNESDFKTFMATKLAAPLVPGQQYCVGFKVHLAPESGFAIDNIGVYFSENPYDPADGEVTPQIGNEPFRIIETPGWKEIASVFTAEEAHEFLTLGNFYDISNTLLNANDIGPSDTAYYYIDDISIAPVEIELEGPEEICMGEDVELFANTNLCEHSWTILGSDSLISETESLEFTPDSTTTFVYIGSNDACDSIGIQYTVNVIPIPDVGEDLILCPGDTLQLNEMNGGGETYTWTPSTGLSDDDIPNPLAYPEETTTYILEVEYPFSTLCAVRDTITITVTEDLANAGEDAVICDGDEIALMATGGDLYSWTPDNNTLSSVLVPDPIAKPEVTTTYVVMVTNSETGCVDTDTITVFVMECDLGGPEWQDEAGNAVEDLCDTTFQDTPIAIALPDIFDPDIEEGLEDVIVPSVILPQHGSITIDQDTAYYNPEDGYIGEDDVYIVACDTASPVQCDTLHLCLTILPPPNMPPAFEDDTLCIVSKIDSFLVQCFDVSDDADLYEDLTFTILVDSVFFGEDVFIDSDNCLNYEGDQFYAGDADFIELEVCDTEGACDTVYINFLIFPPNYPPSIPNEIFGVGQASFKEFCLGIFDQNGDTNWGEEHFTEVLIAPQHGQLAIINDTCMIYTPDPSYIGQDQITFEVCDDGKDITASYNGPCEINEINIDNPLCETVTITFEITDGLIVMDDFINPEDGIGCSIDLLDNDFPPSADSLYIVEGPSFGTINTSNLDDGEVLYVSTVGYEGQDSLIYAVCVNNIGCDTATLYITVMDNISALEDLDTTVANIPVEMDVLTNDTYLGLTELDVEIVDSTNNGQIKITNTGSIIYTPDSNFVGLDMFVYTIINPTEGCEGTGIGSTATATIIVLEPLVPVVIADQATTNVGIPVTIDVLGNDYDELGDSLIIKGLGEPANGTVEIVNGMVVYTPNDGFTGEDSFTYTVCNSNGLTATGGVLVTVLEPECSLDNIMGGFSPNGDGKNDFFRIQQLRTCEEFIENRVTIVNRWGNVVYEQRGYGIDGWWDGRWEDNELPVGTYFYFIEIDGQSEVVRGSVELFR